MPSGKVFISYSHKDEAWKDRLVKHLAVLAKQGLLDIWDDRRIGAGGNWREEIRAALEEADAAVLLISADFLTSDFILNEEVSRLLERRAKSGIHVVPVLVFDCSWQDVPWLAEMQVRPRDGRTLASFKGDQRNRELVKIAREVRQLLAAGSRPQEPSPVEPLQRQPQQQTPGPPQQLAPVSAQALHQLPSPPADFTGREAELTVGKHGKNLARSRSRFWRPLGGAALALAFFYVPILERLTYFIPLSVRPELTALTAVLGGLAGLIWKRRESLSHSRRKWFRVGALAAVTIGLVFLGWLQTPFIVRVPFQSGLLASEIIAPPRIKEDEGCLCRKDESDADCLQVLTANPAEIALCWDGSQLTRLRTLWSLGYLFALSGALSGLLLIRPGKAPRPQPAAVRPAGATGAGLFLSYSRRDREFAERLAGDLTDRGVAVWADWWEMAVGDSLPRKIEESIAKSAWFGIVLSPDSIDSRWVRAELDLALTMEMEGRLSILPILHESCEIPLSLRRKVWADFSSSYEEGLEALLGGLGVASRLDRGV